MVKKQFPQKSVYGLCVSDVKLKQCWKFRILQNWRNAHALANFFCRKCYRELNMPSRLPRVFPSFLHISSNVHKVTRVRNFPLFSNLMRPLLATLTPMFTGFVPYIWYICTLNLIISIRFGVITTNVVILSHCDVIADIIKMKYTFSSLIYTGCF